MKKIFLVYSWLLLTIGVIFISAASIHFFSLTNKSKFLSFEDDRTVENDAVQLADLGEVKGIQTIVESQDARVSIVANFLERYKADLKPYDHFAYVFVSLADENGFDFRLLPAIAMQESNLCKVIPPGSYNCLGFGIHERGTLEFESFEANFTRAARELKANYIDIGLTTPEQIMTKYTPSSNGSWADSVNQWMAEMRYDDRQKGRESEDDNNVLEFVK